MEEFPKKKLEKDLIGTRAITCVRVNYFDTEQGWRLERTYNCADSIWDKQQKYFLVISFFFNRLSL